MSEMTIHDRMMAVYRGETPDRIPLTAYTVNLPRGACERELRELGIGIIDWFPAMSLLAPTWRTREGWMSEVKGADFQVSYSWENGQRVETRTYTTPVGEISRRSSTEPAYGSEWVSKFYITGPEDYKVVQYLVENTVYRRNDSTVRAMIRNLGSDGVVLARMDRSPYQKLLIEIAGPERFLTDLYLNPDPVTELMAVMDRRMDEAFDMVADSEVPAVWQPENITADLTPPGAFKQYSLPFYEKHGQQMRAVGKPYVVHMDGRLGPLRELIAQCPIDVVESLSLPEVGGDLSLTEARSAWPDKVILPNFPSPLSIQSEQEIVAYLERLLEEAGLDVPFTLQISEDIPHDQWQRVLSIVSRFMHDRGKLE